MRDGRIEENWRDVAIEKLNELIPNAGNCQACGRAGTVGVGEHLVTPTVTNPEGGLIVGGASYPQVMLHCTNCGFIRYFNYVLLTTDAPTFDMNLPNG